MAATGFSEILKPNELIEDCTDYDAAMLKLQRHYVKQPNLVFSRHLLATRKQKPGESLRKFLQALQILSKNCQFRDVSSEEYRQELVRDAFVNGLASHHIRQWLLENTEITVDRACTTAISPYGPGTFCCLLFGN